MVDSYLSLPSKSILQKITCEYLFHIFYILFIFLSHLILKQPTINNVSLQTQQRNITIMDHHGVEQQEQHDEATSKCTFEK